jgi:hypothetical protein
MRPNDFAIAADPRAVSDLLQGSEIPYCSSAHKPAPNTPANEHSVELQPELHGTLTQALAQPCSCCAFPQPPLT